MRVITSLQILMFLPFAVVLLSCESQRESLKIRTPGGRQIEALLDRPEGTGRFPVVVVAPGQGYHMRLSLFEKLAEASVENGIVCLRFNWGFYPEGGEPSSDFTEEKDDLSAAIEYARGLDFVDHDKIFVCGKSIGALVGIDLASRDQSLRGLVILTFALHPARPPYKIWPEADKLKEVKIPVQIVSGRSDPICRMEVLVSLVKTLPERPEVVYVEGSHSLKGDTEGETQENEMKAVNAVIDFVKAHL
jgi:predicted alpha/beta-hydrolase family hydrolase